MRFSHIALAVLSSLISATDCLARMYVVGYVPPFLFSSIQLALSAVILLPFYNPIKNWRKTPMPYPRMLYFSFLKGIVISGFLFFGVKLGTSVSVASVISKMCVPCSVILSMIICNEKISSRGIVGITLSVMGVLCFLQSPNVLENFAGFMCFMGFAFFWALYYVQFKKYSEKMNALQFNGWVSLLALPQTLLVSVCFEYDSWGQVLLMPLQGVAWLSYLTVIGFVVNTCLAAYLIKNNDVSKVTSFILLVPVLGIIEAVIFLGEELSTLNIISSVIIIFGLCMIVLPDSLWQWIRSLKSSLSAYVKVNKEEASALKLH